jgi:hypothetical protein
MTNTIKLLDGKVEDKQEVIDNMYSDDYYYGYLGKNALSSSSIKLLLDSAKTYLYISKYGQKETQPLRDGHLFHTMILEPEKLNDIVFVDVQSKNTTKYKEAKKFHDQVFTMKEKNDAERLCDALLRNETALGLIQDSQFEVPMIDTINGYPFRGKADVLKNKGGIVDLKTTIDVKNFYKSADAYRYYNQVYIYCQLFNVDYKDFKFLCIDKKNLDVGVWDCSENFYLKGEASVMAGIEIYKDFIEADFDIDQYIIKGTL